jgi:hypothetical protein
MRRAADSGFPFLSDLDTRCPPEHRSTATVAIHHSQRRSVARLQHALSLTSPSSPRRYAREVNIPSTQTEVPPANSTPTANRADRPVPGGRSKCSLPCTVHLWASKRGVLYATSLRTGGAHPPFPPITTRASTQSLKPEARPPSLEPQVTDGQTTGMRGSRLGRRIYSRQWVVCHAIDDGCAG